MELTLALDPTEVTPDLRSAANSPGVSARVESFTARMHAGDEAAWREFHAAYAPRLFRYLVAVTGGRDQLARDALAQTFLRAVRHIRPFSTDEALWCWLTVLARSAVTDEWRRQTRRDGLIRRWWQSRAVLAPVELPTEFDEVSLLERLDRELDRLPDADRELLTRKYLRNESVRDIAATVGITEKAVESRLSRARSLLRSRLFRRLHDER